MSGRREVAVLLAALLACLAHPCPPQDRWHPGESAAAHGAGTALEPTGCEPDVTASTASNTPSSGPAGILVAGADARLRPPAGHAASGRPPTAVPHPPLFLLHSALLA